MLKDESFNWRRLLFGILIGSILVYVLVLRGTAAEAAQDVTCILNGVSTTHTIWDISECDWSEWSSSDYAMKRYSAPSELCENIIDECSYMVVLYSGDSYIYCFGSSPFELFNGLTYHNYAYVRYCSIIFYYSCNYIVIVQDVSGSPVVTGVSGMEDLDTFHSLDRIEESIYLTRNIKMLGSSYDIFEGYTDAYYDEVKAGVPYNNLSYPTAFSKLSVNITVNEVDYTVSEAYPYYLALKNPQGNIRLFFSDSPFTATWADLYTFQFEIAPDANVVKYYWDSREQNDFLASRSVSVGFDAFVFKAAGDHMSNYSIPDTRNPLYYILYEKAAFTLPTETLTAKDLYAVLPDELSKYYHIIIFRQDSPNAYDNRILFYGWNDNNASLYINSRTSGIAAFNKKGSVSDYATAYYDETSNSWVVSDDVILGTTKDYSYSVPFIYYSDLELFVCEEFGSWNGQIAYVGDDERPLVSIVDPDSPEADEQETLIDKFISGLSNLFKNLFVPSSGFFDAKVNYMKSKFSFYEAISSTGAAILDFFTETDFSEPPKITVNLSAARSKYNYGETAICLDMSWYEEYKPYVDAFLSGVLWLVFGWNTFKNLPSIISGVTTAANVSTEISRASESKLVEIPKFASNAKTCPPEFMIKR